MSFYQKAEKTQFWRVVIMLAPLLFLITTEFVPVALLTDIGQSFDMQSSDVGLMMTVYAWTVMIMSLPAMLATGDMERKGLLLKLFRDFYYSAILSRSSLGITGFFLLPVCVLR